MTSPNLQHALKLHRAGRLAEAEAIYRAILRSEPRNFDCLYRRGIALAQTGNFEDAAASIRKALAVRPDFAQGHLDLGNLEARAGRFEAAAAQFARAGALDPALVEAEHNLGNALHALGRFEDAAAAFTRVLARQPGHVLALFNRGNAWKALGRFEDAAADYRAALAREPDFAPAVNNLGLALLWLHRPDDALAQFRRALELRPDHPEYVNNSGLALDELRRFDDALAAYDRALALRPDYAEAWYNCGITLSKLRRFDDALAAYDRALALRPDYAEAHNNRGVALQDLSRFDDALECYGRAIALKPDYHDALWNRSFCRLLTGDFSHGWDGFEERWRKSGGQKGRLALAPEWDGRSRVGSLLALREQGVGDEIFYSGMLADLATFADRLSVCIDPRLHALFRRSFPTLNILRPDELGASSAFDAQVYLGSLGGYFRTAPADFANSVRPYLRADGERAAGLRARLARPGRLLCGLSWASKGKAKSGDDPLTLLALHPVLALPEFDFVDLQYGDTRAEQETLRAATGVSLVGVPEIDNFNDLDGLAALIEACDVVVTVSNTTAHLAAALGKPVFVMLSHAPGLLWYWHTERTDSPWYPSAHLFRQPHAGDWKGVVAEVRAALCARTGIAAR